MLFLTRKKSRKGESRVKSYSKFLHDGDPRPLLRPQRAGPPALWHAPHPQHLVTSLPCPWASEEPRWLLSRADGVPLSSLPPGIGAPAEVCFCESHLCYGPFMLWDSLMSFWSFLLVMGPLIRLLLYIQICNPGSWKLASRLACCSLGAVIEQRKDPLPALLVISCHLCVCLVKKSCLILCDLVDCSPPGSFVHGIL